MQTAPCHECIDSTGRRHAAGRCVRQPVRCAKAIGQNPAPAPGAVTTVQPLWASNTTGRSAEYFAVQDDGNLVIYTAKNEAVWSSGTQGDWLSGLYLQTNGNLVLYKLAPAWGTNTAQK